MSKRHGVESSLEVGAKEEPLDVLYCFSLRSICSVCKFTFSGGKDLACEQALRGALVAGREREGQISQARQDF